MRHGGALVDAHAARDRLAHDAQRAARAGDAAPSSARRKTSATLSGGQVNGSPQIATMMSPSEQPAALGGRVGQDRGHAQPAGRARAARAAPPAAALDRGQRRDRLGVDAQPAARVAGARDRRSSARITPARQRDGGTAAYRDHSPGGAEPVSIWTQPTRKLTRPSSSEMRPITVKPKVAPKPIIRVQMPTRVATPKAPVWRVLKKK